MSQPFLPFTIHSLNLPSLLPKLISGELRLPAASSIAELAAQAGIEDAEKMVETI